MRSLALTFALAAIASPASGQSAPLLVTVSDLAGMLSDPQVVVLHVSDRVAAFEEAHIPGARFLRYGDFAAGGPADLGSELPPAGIMARVFESLGISDSTRVVLYSQSPVYAARAFFTLDAFGHRHVALLDGGLRAWRDEGRPTESGPAKPPRAGRFTARLDAARVADAAFIQKQVPGQTMSLVDVRPDDEFLGRNTMGDAHAAGHIKGARQLPWNSLLGADGRFLSRDQLHARLQSVIAGKPVVAYCMVGMRASVVYFVARYLGYDAKLYDGSIVDWSRRGLPTVQ
jgi:thiosulfate/3-mercaptopyruvate sulfurtransferase